MSSTSTDSRPTRSSASNPIKEGSEREGRGVVKGESQQVDAPPAWAMRLVRARVGIVVTLAFFTALMGWSATRLAFDFSPDNLFVSGDPELAFFRDVVIPAFGDAGATCVVAIEGDLRTPEVQRALHDVTAALATIDGVAHVLSPTSISLPTPGALGYAPLFDVTGSGASGGGHASVADLERAALDPNVGGVLLSADLHLTAVIASLSPPRDRDSSDTQGAVLSSTKAQRDARAKTVAAVVNASDDVARRHPTIKFHLAGVPISHGVIVSTLKRDQVRFIPLVILVMALLLWIFFRDLRGVLLPFIATGCAAIWCVGVMSLAGHAINVVNNAIVVLLLVVGIADGVHLVARYLSELADERARCGHDDVDADVVIARTVAAMTLPCMLTTATTAVGFLGALVAQMHLVREFGLDAAGGVLGAFVATMLVVPSLLGFLPLPKARREFPQRKARQAPPAPEDNSGKKSNDDSERPVAQPLAQPRLVGNLMENPVERILSGVLHQATTLALNRPATLVAIFCAATLALGVAASRVVADQTLLSELPDTSPSRKALTLLEEKLAGVLPIEVIYQVDDVDTYSNNGNKVTSKRGSSAALIAPETIRHMARLQQALQRGDVGRAELSALGLAPIATKTRSLVNVYTAVAQSVGGDLAKKPATSWSDVDIRQLQLLFELAPPENQAAALAGVLAPDFGVARLIAFCPDAGTRRFLPFKSALQKAIEEAPPGVKVRVSGGQVVATGALETVTADMISSVGLAFVLIFVFVSLLFRSLVVGALALVPNALPLLATLAAMGILGVPLRLATVLTFCMALGVAVDACIHLLARLREEMSVATRDVQKNASASADDVTVEMLRAAIERTMVGAGRPVVISTVLLLGGFLVLSLSDFSGLRDFAILSAATLTCALVVDLLLLPALILLVRPRFPSRGRHEKTPPSI